MTELSTLEQVLILTNILSIGLLLSLISGVISR